MLSPTLTSVGRWGLAGPHFLWLFPARPPSLAAFPQTNQYNHCLLHHTCIRLPLPAMWVCGTTLYQSNRIAPGPPSSLPTFTVFDRQAIDGAGFCGSDFGLGHSASALQSEPTTTVLCQSSEALQSDDVQASQLTEYKATSGRSWSAAAFSAYDSQRRPNALASSTSTFVCHNL
jgi:hypothetical protein